MKLLRISFTSPSDSLMEFARYISLEDLIGKFSVYPGHEGFITVLGRSIGYYVKENGEKWFVAHDYGVFRVENDEASVLTRIFLKGKSVEELRAELGNKLKRVSKYDILIRKNLKNLEKFLLKRMVEVERLFKDIDRKLKRMSKGEGRGFWGTLTFIGSISVIFVVPVIIGAYIGWVIDGRYKTGQVSWTITLMLVGVIVGVYSVYHSVYKRL